MYTRKKFKPFVLPVLYGIVLLTVVISLLIATRNLLKSPNPGVKYITTSTITDDVEPVISEAVKIVKPFKDSNIKILTHFYDVKASSEIQEKSLILFENTYIPSTGIDYGMEKQFDINSISNGTVIETKTDELLGQIIKIEYTNNIIGTYSCLSSVDVKENDIVSSGQKIGTSGTCNIGKNLGNHLHFEILKDGKNINPENFYGSEA